MEFLNSLREASDTGDYQKPDGPLVCCCMVFPMSAGKEEVLVAELNKMGLEGFEGELSCLAPRIREIWVDMEKALSCLWGKETRCMLCGRLELNGPNPSFPNRGHAGAEPGQP